MKEVYAMIVDLAAAYGKKLDDGAITMYLNALRGYSHELIRHGIDVCLQEERFMPSAAAIIQAVSRFRVEHPPEPNRACPECAGTGYVQMYLKFDAKAMQAQKWNGRMPPTQEAIERGFLVPITEEEYRKNQPATYSFAKRCEMCR